MAILRHAPVSLIWSIARKLGERNLFDNNVKKIRDDFSRNNGDIDIRMPAEIVISRATLPEPTGRHLSANRFRGRVPEEGLGPRHYRMVLFSDQYRFGGNTYDSRQSMRPSENHMRAKFDGPNISDNSTQFPIPDGMTPQEYLATQLHIYAWALADLFDNDAITPLGIKTIDNVNIIPEVSEVQEDIIELPVVQAVALNFTVFTD